MISLGGFFTFPFHSNKSNCLLIFQRRNVGRHKDLFDVDDDSDWECWPSSSTSLFLGEAQF